MPNGTDRSTGVSLAAVVLVSVCFGAMVMLHAMRTDLDPVRQVMSEYANGRFGIVMTAAFYAFGLTCMALALRLGRAMARRRLAVVVRVLLGLGGLGLILAGVFEVERPAVPDTIEEILHSDATLAAFTLDHHGDAPVRGDVPHRSALERLPGSSPSCWRSSRPWPVRSARSRGRRRGAAWPSGCSGSR